MVRPKYIVVENVAALINRGLDTVLADLVSCGYDSEWDCLPAQAIGAPHRRDRVFIIAYPMAHTLSNGVHEGDREDVNRRKEGKEYPNISVCSSKGKYNVPDSIRAGPQGHDKEEPVEREQKAQSGCRSDIIPDTYDYNYWKQRQKSIQEANRKEYWATDAGVLRVANGISNRIQRIKCLGNAIVPQVAEFIGEKVIELNGRLIS